MSIVHVNMYANILFHVVLNMKRLRLAVQVVNYLPAGLDTQYGGSQINTCEFSCSS